jgi:transcription initiation factor TFIID TATA-box-binding protein
MKSEVACYPLSLPNVKVVNIVASTNANRQINIELLSTNFQKAVYEPEIFPGLIYRRNNPKATVIIFSTGKIVSIGSRSEDSACKSIMATVSEIEQSEGDKIKIEKIKVENVVAVSDLCHYVDMDKIMNCGIEHMHKPEGFHGVIYRIKNDVAVIIFKSGKIISVGSKSENEAKAAIHFTFEILISNGCLSVKK